MPAQSVLINTFQHCAPFDTAHLPCLWWEIAWAVAPCSARESGDPRSRWIPFLQIHRGSSHGSLYRCPLFWDKLLKLVPRTKLSRPPLPHTRIAGGVLSSAHQDLNSNMWKTLNTTTGNSLAWHAQHACSRCCTQTARARWRNRYNLEGKVQKENCRVWKQEEFTPAHTKSPTC